MKTNTHRKHLQYRKFYSFWVYILFQKMYLTEMWRAYIQFYFSIFVTICWHYINVHYRRLFLNLAGGFARKSFLFILHPDQVAPFIVHPSKRCDFLSVLNLIEYVWELAIILFRSFCMSIDAHHTHRWLVVIRLMR